MTGAPWLSDVPEQSWVVGRVHRWVDEWFELVVVEAGWQAFAPDVADHFACCVAIGVVMVPGGQVHRIFDWRAWFIHWKACPIYE